MVQFFASCTYVQHSFKSFFHLRRNMMQHHQEIVRCLRGKSAAQLVRLDLVGPSFLASVGPSRDGILIPSDFGAPDDDESGGGRSTMKRRKRGGSRADSYQVLLGLVRDETSHFFSDSEWSSGLGPRARDRYLRTLVRNSYDFHLNEIFATVQNEYSDWGGLDDDGGGGGGDGSLLARASRALTDKLYLSPAEQTAEWCERSGFPTYIYVFGDVHTGDEANDGVSETTKLYKLAK